MNIQNFFLTMLLSIGHTIISSEEKITGSLLEKEITESIIAYCNTGEHISHLDIIPIFFKNGQYWKTIADIKKWDLQNAPKEERMNTLRAHSDFFDELRDQRVAVCRKTEKDSSGNTTTKVVFVRKVHNCSVCNDERFFK